MSSLFYFPSRTRHTMSYGDWSSGVCSSDLDRLAGLGLGNGGPALQVGLAALLRPDQLDKLFAQKRLWPDHGAGILAQPDVGLERHADERAPIVRIADG